VRLTTDSGGAEGLFSADLRLGCKLWEIVDLSNCKVSLQKHTVESEGFWEE
jgi:hypothetical protein